MKGITLILIGALIGISPLSVHAEIRTKNIPYQDGEVQLQGYLVWDDAIEGKRPGVVVAHEWWGLNDYIRRRARMLAELGFAAFAIDMYGSSKVTEHGETAQEWMQQITANADRWQRRALRGLEVFRSQPQVDPGRIAAIGYCFGGATVMQMAYAGAELQGVVSFHGSLPLPSAEQARRLKTAVLAFSGAADEFVPPEKVQAFQGALEKTGADWQVVLFGGARHAFTNPGADRYGIENLRYNAKADERSWRYMQLFFDEVLGIPKRP